MMKCIVEEHEGAVVLRISGRIDIGVGDIRLRETLEEAQRLGNKTIILDLARVSYMDSAGAGELVAAYTKLQEDNVSLCLSNLHPKVYGLLDLTRLITVFPVYDSNEDALMSRLKAA